MVAGNDLRLCSKYEAQEATHDPTAEHDTKKVASKAALINVSAENADILGEGEGGLD